MYLFTQTLEFMKKEPYYCFIGGHSGGHIMPSSTLSHTIKQHNPEALILFFTTTSALDTQLTATLRDIYTVIQLPIYPFSIKNPATYIYRILQIVYSFFVALYYFVRYKPTSVTSTGGIITIPITLAAFALRIPIDLYELNVLPGKTTYFLAPIARTIYCSFKRTQIYLPTHKTAYSAYPIRFFNKRQLSQKKALTTLNIPPHKKVIFILGGSQGSLFINNAVKKWLEQEMDYSSFYIIHQTGSHDTTDWLEFYADMGVDAITFTFSENMEQYYAAADLIICRSGAGSLFETLYFNKKCITIPLVTQRNNHQLHNAFTIVHEHPELFTVLTQEEIARYPLILHSII